MNYFTSYFKNKLEQHLNESPEGYDDESVLPMHKYVDNLTYEDLFSHTGKHSDEEIAKRLHKVATEPHKSSISEKAYKILTNRYPEINGYAEDVRKQVRNNPNEYSAKMVSHVLASSKNNEDVVKTLKNMSSSHFFFRSPLAYHDSNIEGRLFDKKTYDELKSSNVKHKDDILAHTEFWNRHHKEEK